MQLTPVTSADLVSKSALLLLLLLLLLLHSFLCAQILEEMEGSNLHVITRTGNPAKPTEQKRASAASAETVVLMWPAGLPAAEASAQQAAVLAALKTAGGVVGQKVVVQSAGEDAAQFDAVKVGG
jgi:hypothetical protein